MFTLENTDDSIKRAQNYIQCQDTAEDKRVSFSSDVDADNEHEEVKTLRVALKDKDQRLSVLEVKFDILLHETKDGGNYSCVVTPATTSWSKSN